MSEFSELLGDIKGEEQDEIEHECDNPIIKMKYQSEVSKTFKQTLTQF